MLRFAFGPALTSLALATGFLIGLFALDMDKAWAHHSGKQVAASVAAGKRCGSASWYALDGRTTANGEVMNSSHMTAAHPRLPFGTKLLVTNLLNGKSVTVRINDRGPFAKGRVLDLSKAAARRLGFASRGHTKVAMKPLNARWKRGANCA